MTRPYYEIVTYSVSDPEKADRARSDAMQRLKSFPGFISWTAFTGAGQAAMRTDLVAWTTLAEANSAAKAVETAPEFAGFRACVASVMSMQHYEASGDQVRVVASGNGFELGRFRLREYVSEDDMRHAHLEMVTRYLGQQPGWRGQYLLTFDDGTFADLAFADSRNRAEAICNTWNGQKDCEAFLALIEPIGIEFGSLA